MSPALWICPGHLQGEVEQLVAELGARAWVTLFPAGAPTTAVPLPQAAAEWWDLDALRTNTAPSSNRCRRSRQSRSPPTCTFSITGACCRTSTQGSRPSMLPDDWPGGRSFAEFARLSHTLADAAWRHVLEVTEAARPS